MPALILSRPFASLRAVAPAPVLRGWVQRRATRAALARLDTHLLNDIGLAAPTARGEASKPFWKA